MPCQMSSRAERVGASRAGVAKLLTLARCDIELHWHGLAVRLRPKCVMSRLDRNKPGLIRLDLAARVRGAFQRKCKRKASKIRNLQLRRRQWIAGGAGGHGWRSGCRRS